MCTVAQIFGKQLHQTAKGLLKNYVILLGGGGRSPKDCIRLQGGRGGDTPKGYI